MRILALVTIAFLLGGCGDGQKAQAPAAAAAKSTYLAADEQVKIQAAGKKSEGRIVTTGKDGFVMFGPNVPWPAGEYEVVITGEAKIRDEGKAFFDVVHTRDQKSAYLGSRVLTAAAKAGEGGVLVAFPFTAPADVQDLQVRASVSGPVEMSISKYEIKRR